LLAIETQIIKLKNLFVGKFTLGIRQPKRIFGYLLERLLQKSEIAFV